VLEARRSIRPILSGAGEPTRSRFLPVPNRSPSRPTAAPSVAPSRTTPPSVRPSSAPARRAPRGEFEPSYVTRKRLAPRELLPAAGVGLALGLAAFYVMKVWLERTPVLPPASPPVPDGDEPVSPVNRTVTPQRAAP
jgi:hypothetical protein